MPVSFSQHRLKTGNYFSSLSFHQTSSHQRTPKPEPLFLRQIQRITPHASLFYTSSSDLRTHPPLLTLTVCASLLLLSQIHCCTSQPLDRATSNALRSGGTPSTLTVQTDIGLTPIALSGHREIRRLPRHLPVQPQSTTRPPVVPDDVTFTRLFPSACETQNNPYRFSQILNQISIALSHPITAMMTESLNLMSWLQGRGCIAAAEEKQLTDTLSGLDLLISQLITLLPGSQPLAVTQYIIAPLLAKAARDLEGIVLPDDQDLSLIQQLTQQARISRATLNHHARQTLTGAYSSTRWPTLGLPVIHLTEKGNYIDLHIRGKIQRVPVREHAGCIYAMMPHGRRRKRIYFNHLIQKWEVMAKNIDPHNIRQEQDLLSALSLHTDYRRPAGTTDRLTPYMLTYPQLSGEKEIMAIEMTGRLVPVRYDSTHRKTFIYDASGQHLEQHEVIFWQQEWHLTLPVDKQPVMKRYFSVKEGKIQNFAVIRQENGREILAHVNPRTGSYRGREYVLNPKGDLDLYTARKHRHDVKRKRAMAREYTGEALEAACRRVKRGLNILALCTGQTPDNPVIGEGSISKVYDLQDGYVLKVYTGKMTPQYKSRLQYAINNVRGFNRYYGPASGFLRLTPAKDASASVSVRLRKIHGIALNAISTVTDDRLLHIMQDAISAPQLAHHLAAQLQQKGIAHYDINKGNILFSPLQGFSIIDFDSAVISPENQAVSQSITDWMTSTLGYVLNEAHRDILHQSRILRRKRA